MSLIAKALKAAAQVARRGEAPDPGATIRAALSAAGLAPKGASTGDASTGRVPDGFGCFAPTGSPTGLSAFAPFFRAPDGRAPAQAAPAGNGTFTWRSLAGPWGTRRFKLFVPAAASPPRALLVMLHGCSQDPDDFAGGTRMNAVAADANVLVLYPEQVRSANFSKCWNWFDAAHQRHGAGEPGMIAAMARAVMAEFGLPPGRAFAAGLSAGGAMAAVLAHTDPDLFAAVGVHSGLPYGAASDVASAFAAMRGEGARGEGVGAAHTGRPAIIFHGDADRTVHVSNADALVAGLTVAGGRATVEAGRAPDGTAYTRTLGRDAAGGLRFEDWRIVGAGHAWSGGSSAGSYADPHGPDASDAMMRFFLARLPDDAAGTPALTAA